MQLVQGKKQRHRSQIVWRLWEEMKKDGVSLESTSVDDLSKDAFASDMQTSDTEDSVKGASFPQGSVYPLRQQSFCLGIPWT